jgi:hypothetical protein
MIALFLLLIIAAIALGIVGVVAKGLLYLLIIGIVVFLGALVLGALRMRRRPGRRRPDDPIQPLHLLAQRRLDDVLPVGRPAEVQLLRQRHEIAKLP